MRQFTNQQLDIKINRFLNRKSEKFNLKDPLASIQPRARDIGQREIMQSYRYAPDSMRRAFTY